MSLSSLPFPVFGNPQWRGDCPREDVEQATFFNWLRREFPTTWGILGLHPRNEGLKTGGQIAAVAKHRVEGMAKGAADIIIPSSPSFVCELKRRDRTKSKWQDGQVEYLTAAHEAGAFACVALGAEAAKEAFREWLRSQAKN